MKFVSWNVNGLRACIQKGFLDAFNDFNADFFCLQETKLSEGQLQLDLPGYEQYWCYAEKKGYSGTAIFTKHSPLQVTYGIGVPELDNEGRVITLEYREFFLVTCYTPNAQRGLARIGHRMTWDEAFRDYLTRLDHQKPVILCGDLNVAHKEIDLKNPSSNRGNAGFSDQERDSFQRTLNLGFTDTFRHLYPDVTGRYSWWSYMFHARENNAGWRIDYFLVSDRLKDSIYRADIHSDILGSDHCPVSLELDTLVNGGIWSPEIIPSAPVEPDPVTEETPTPPSVSKKGIATIVSIFLVFTIGLLAILFYPGVTPESVLPPTESPFQITHFYTPLKMESYYYGDYDEETDAVRRYGVVVSDIERFYVRNMTGLDYANVFLRITPKDGEQTLNPDDWKFSFLDAVTETELDNLTSNSLFNIQPYYSDRSLDAPVGYLVWGRMMTYEITPVTVHMTDTKNDIQYSDTTKLAPYLTQTDVKGISTVQLLYYMSEHPYIFAQMTNIPLDSTAFLSDADYYTSRLVQLRNNYPAVKSFFDRTDCIDVLMKVVTEHRIFNQNLLYAALHLGLLTPKQEYEFLTGQYPAGGAYLFLDDPYTPQTPTENVMIKAFGGQVGKWLAECTSQTSRSLVYEYARQHNPWIRAFEDRSDCISILMNTDRFAGLHITDNFGSTAMEFVPHRLLSLEIYRAKMTPLEEARFLTYSYYSCPLQPKTIVEPGTDLKNYDTAALINRAYAYDISNILPECSSDESLYHACQLISEYHPYIAELMQREDAIATLEKLSTLPSRNDYYNLLLRALTYDPNASVDDAPEEPAIA